MFIVKKSCLLLGCIVSCLAIQSISLPSSLASQIVSTKFVRLLFPLTKGTELEILAAYINQPKLYSIGKETFVLAAEHPDAIVAYRLGKSIQSKTKLAFVLVYDPGHPQSDFRWMQTINSPKKVSTKLKPQVNQASFSSFPSSPASHPPSTLSDGGAKGKIFSDDDNSLISDSRECVPVAKCLSTISTSTVLVRDKDKSSFSFVPVLRDSSQIFSLRKSYMFGVQTLAAELLLNPGYNLFGSKTNNPPSKADYSPGMLVKHLVRSSSGSIMSNLGISKERIDELGQTDKSVGGNAASFNGGSGGNIAHPSLIGKLGSFSIIKETPSSMFIDDSIVALSPSPFFSLADPGLTYIFVRISDKVQLASLFNSRKPQAFYRINLNLYAQIAVHNSSRVGRQLLGTDMGAISKLGLTPILLSPGQVLAMVSSVG
jgi:hypothetical protein